MCCVLQATQNFVIVFFGHVVSVSQAGQSNIFQLELHVVASALGMTQKKRCLALQVLNSCHQVGWAHLVQDNPAETIAVVSQEGNKKPWVSASSNFATALELYKQQLEDDEPIIDQDVFTYSRTQNNTWTGIVRDPAQAKAICNKKASTAKCYNKLVLYHVDSGQNVANTEDSTD